MLPHRAPHLLTVCARAALPRRAVTVSEWADAHRELTAKQSGERGRWRTARTPFLREIMDCCSATSRVRKVVVKKSAQVGVTEAMINMLGYLIDHAPAPVMVLMPSLEARDAWKTQKLNPLLTDTPAVARILGGNRSRAAANRQDLIDFPGGVLFLAGGNSPNSYAQRSVKILLMDDLDRFPAEVGAEGDPVDLARNRLKAFARSLLMLVSTPTEDDTSLIAREYQDSDRRRYHVPCPHCHEMQPLDWGGEDLKHGVKWTRVGDQVTDAWYVCAHCRAEIREHHKPRMLAAGRWVADNPGHPTRGYHISELYAPVGLGGSWRDLAQDWLGAQKSQSKLKTFLNTRLGETWTAPGDSVDPTGLLARLEPYPDPAPRLARTLGVDVQKDRLEVTVDDWARGEECWTCDHIILPGDTAQPEVWEDLAALCDELAPDAAGIDSGYNTSMVHAFVKGRRWAYALKGVPGPGRPIVEDERVRRQRLRRKTKRGIITYLLGDDQAKALIHSRLRLVEPGPGYVHFPNTGAFDDEYFQQLTAERLEVKTRGTRPIAVWVQLRARNEALDCKKLSLAALRLAGINLDTRARAADQNAAAAAAGLPAAAPGPVRPGLTLANWRR